MSIVGRTYIEYGKPVEVLAQWRTKSGQPFDPLPPAWLVNLATRKGSASGPRNVLIRRENGDLVVRPFRGLTRRRCWLCGAKEHDADVTGIVTDHGGRTYCEGCWRS